MEGRGETRGEERRGLTQGGSVRNFTVGAVINVNVHGMVFFDSDTAGTQYQTVALGWGWKDGHGAKCLKRNHRTPEVPLALVGASMEKERETYV